MSGPLAGPTGQSECEEGVGTDDGHGLDGFGGASAARDVRGR